MTDKECKCPDCDIRLIKTNIGDYMCMCCKRRFNNEEVKRGVYRYGNGIQTRIR